MAYASNLPQENIQASPKKIHETLFLRFSQIKQAWPSSKYLSSVTGTVCSIAMEGKKKKRAHQCWFEESPKVVVASGKLLK
jgi:glycogen debranching enzyme